MIESHNALDNAAPSFERELSNYQAAVSKSVQSSPSTDPRHQRELDAYAQRSTPAGNEQPTAPMAASTRDNDLAVIDSTFRQVDPRTGRAYGLNPQISGVLEQARGLVLSGKAIDRTALAVELSKFTGIPVPKAQEPTASIEPQGTPEERDAAALTQQQEAAIDKILPHIDAEGGIEGRHLTPDVTAGYVLPDHLVFDTELTLNLCAQARRAGFSQSDVNRWIEANS